MAKPFIKWVGGKTQLLNIIERTLPADFSQRKNVTYIEPFVGGGAVLFWILQKYPNITQAVITDINPDLMLAYQIVRDNPEDLILELQAIQSEYMPLNDEQRKLYYMQKRARFNTKSLDVVENTALFIFLNRTCFNGLYRVNKHGLFNVPFGRYANPKICDEQTILADSKLLQKVRILTGDFSETLQFADKNSFFYCDPPYKPLSKTSSFTSYAKENFNDAEQIRLRDFCVEINRCGAHFILSNADVKGKNPHDDFFDKLYAAFDIKRVFATRMVNANAAKRGKLTELMINNFCRPNYIPILHEYPSYQLLGTIEKKVAIERIHIDKQRLDYANPIYKETVESIVHDFHIEGWEPIFVDDEYFIRDGQHRYTAAKEMGLKYIDVLVLSPDNLAHDNLVHTDFAVEHYAKKHIYYDIQL
ncbi:MAG: Dam family site-specific DNA-(adenine-N6)-methyltransferase [Paludibacteraceae bacterium]